MPPDIKRRPTSR